jgi:hypothetical protein
MGWLHQFRVWLLPTTARAAQQHVDTIERRLARLRAEVAALPPDERAARAHEIQALLIAQARARTMLSDALDDRAER